MPEPSSVIEAIRQHRRMLTPAKLAELLALSPKTLYARVKAGTIPSIRIGGSIRFDPAVTANWLQSKMA